MKINKQKNKKLAKLGSVIILIFLLGLAIYLFLFKGSLFGWSVEFTSNIPSSEQIQAGKDIEKRTAENSKEGTEPNNVGSDRPLPPREVVNDKATVSVKISSVNQNDGTLQIRTLIGTITSKGLCTLTLKKNNSIITRIVDVQALPSSATCKGFDIPLPEIPPGEWEAILQFETETMKGSETRTITVI